MGFIVWMDDDHFMFVVYLVDIDDLVNVSIKGSLPVLDFRIHGLFQPRRHLLQLLGQILVLITPAHTLVLDTLEAMAVVVVVVAMMRLCLVIGQTEGHCR